jgi:membrane protease YdiL (CAAX protease family)
VTRTRILVLTLGAYGTLAALGEAFCVWRGRPMVFVHPEPWLELERPWDLLASLGAGIVVAALTLAFTRVVVRRARWARELHVAFREMLGPSLDGVTIAVLALASGLGEEIFFRGALQPSFGLVLTSFVFGVVHVGPDRRFLAWTLWALVMGFVLGAVHEATGSLLGAIVAHVAINYENLHFIASYDPREPARNDSSGPRLVAEKKRL